MVVRSENRGITTSSTSKTHQVRSVFVHGRGLSTLHAKQYNSTAAALPSDTLASPLSRYCCWILSFRRLTLAFTQVDNVIPPANTAAYRIGCHRYLRVVPTKTKNVVTFPTVAIHCSSVVLSVGGSHLRDFRSSACFCMAS